MLSASSKQTKLVAAEDQYVVLPRDVARQGCQGAPHCARRNSVDEIHIARANPAVLALRSDVGGASYG